MNLVQIGTNVAQDDFFNIVENIDKSQIDNLILVEPLGVCNDKISTCYNGYNFVLENVVINTDPSIKKELFYMASVNNYLSSLKHGHIEKHNTREETLQIQVDAITVNELFDKYSMRYIDILFIDCEGMDDKIIESINFEKYSIDKIYYEHIHIDNGKLISYLNNNGYEVSKCDFEDGFTSVAIKK
jgi:FkbM family methyltransferase